MSAIKIQTISYTNLGWQTAADACLPLGFDDEPEPVAIAMAKVVPFFKEKL